MKLVSPTLKWLQYRMWPKNHSCIATSPATSAANSKPAHFARRQDAPSVWGLNGSIYVWRRAALPKAVAQGFWGVRAKPYAMPRRRSVDIDDLEDFELAQWLLQRGEA